MTQAINLLDERLYEWSRLHSQEIVHGKDLAEGLERDETWGSWQKPSWACGIAAEAGDGVETAASCLAPNLASLAGRSWRQG